MRLEGMWKGLEEIEKEEAMRNKGNVGEDEE